MKSRQEGFTLIESLVVLSIFMIISSVTVFSLKPQQPMIEEEAFITQLKADLYYAQNYAISHQHEVSVVFMPSQSKYEMYLRTDIPPFIVRNYPKNIYVYEGSLPLYFKFLSDGNVNKFGTLYIQTKRKDYRVTVLIGRGRFYVAEQ